MASFFFIRKKLKDLYIYDIAYKYKNAIRSARKNLLETVLLTATRNSLLYLSP